MMNSLKQLLIKWLFFLEKVLEKKEIKLWGSMIIMRGKKKGGD